MTTEPIAHTMSRHTPMYDVIVKVDGISDYENRSLLKYMVDREAIDVQPTSIGDIYTLFKKPFTLTNLYEFIDYIVESDNDDEYVIHEDQPQYNLILVELRNGLEKNVIKNNNFYLFVINLSDVWQQSDIYKRCNSCGCLCKPPVSLEKDWVCKKCGYVLKFKNMVLETVQ